MAANNPKKVVKKKGAKPTVAKLVNPWLLAGLLAIFAFVLYANTLGHSYNMDDELVTNNHRYTSKGFAGIKEIVSNPYYSDNAGNQYGYRPIPQISFAIEHQLLGQSPQTSHAINVLLYALTAMLLFLTLKAVFKDYSIWFAFLASLLFVAHPLHTEVVASIKNREELLAFFFGLLAIRFAFYAIDKKQIVWLLLVPFFYGLGVYSKLSIVPLAILLPLSVVLFRPVKLWQLMAITIPLAAIAAKASPIVAVSAKVLVFAAITVIPLLLSGAINKRELVKKWLAESAGNKTIIWSLIVTLGLALFLLAVLGLAPLFLAVVGLAVLIIAAQLSDGWQRLITVNLLLIVAAVVAFLLEYFVVGHLMLIGVIFQLFVNQHEFRWYLPGLAVYLGLGFITPNELLTLIPVTLFPLAAYLLVNRQLKAFAIGLQAVILVIVIITYFIGNTAAEIILLPLAGLLLLLSYNRPAAESKKIWLSPAVYTVMATVAFMLASVNETPEATSPIAEAEIETAELSITNPPPSTSIGRALDFSENPLVADGITPSQRYGTAMNTMATYLKLLVVPYPLRVYYGYNQIKIIELSHPLSIATLLVLLILILASFLLLQKHPILSLGVWGILGSLFIFSNTSTLVAGIVGERLAYFASLWFCLLLAYLLFLLFKKNPKTYVLPKGGLLVAAITISCVYSIITVSRNPNWKDHYTIFSNDIKYLDESSKAHNLLANRSAANSYTVQNPVERNQLLQDAITHYKRSIEIFPEFPYAYHDLGNVYLLLGDKQAALQAFNQSVSIDKPYADTYMRMGSLYEEVGNPQQAELNYLKAIEIDSVYPQPYTNLSYLRFKQGNYQGSVNVNLTLLRHRPNMYEPLVNIGKTYTVTGDTQLAIYYLEQAYLVNPTAPQLASELSKLFYNIGNYEKAEEYAKFAP